MVQRLRSCAITTLVTLPWLQLHWSQTPQSDGYSPMATDETLLQYIEEMLPKLTDKHAKLVDICLALRGYIRDKQRSKWRPPPKRDRAAYMRAYRARKEAFRDR